MWFYCLVAAAVALRILYFNVLDPEAENPTIKSAFSSTLAALVVSKIAIEPTLEWIPTEEPERYRDALVVAYALTGHEIVVGILRAARNPKEAITFLKSVLWRKPT